MLGSTSFDGFSRTTIVAEPAERRAHAASKGPGSAPSTSRRRSSTSRGLLLFVLGSSRSRTCSRCASPERSSARNARSSPSSSSRWCPIAARVPRRALLLAVRDPGAVHRSARLRSVRARAGLLRDGGLRPEPRDRLAEHDLVRAGRRARGRPRRGPRRSRTTARWRCSAIAATPCARSTRCWR